MTTVQLREEALKVAPTLSAAAKGLSDKWCDCILKALDALNGKPSASPKTFADPILGTIDLFEWELLLVDSPFLQRLRGVKQLGLVHFVYPGAVHDRFTHSLGVVEVADRMVEGLTRNAQYRTNYGAKRLEGLPLTSPSDRFTIRLAALLHDVGHGAFSHASEDLIYERHTTEFEGLKDLLRKNFEGARGVKPSEAIAVLLIISESLQRVFDHPRFTIPVENKTHLPFSIVSLILGARGGHLQATYLNELISGPIDADKLDYMARDSFYTGLPVGIDVNRLIKKLEIVQITAENAPNDELKKRVEAAPNGSVYEMGVSLSGLTAYEQMIVGRALLYDRVYFHQKVRCGEAMVRMLFRSAEEERGKHYEIEDLFENVSDDAMVHLLGGRMTIGKLNGGTEKSAFLASCIQTRNLYQRAFAFASRFFAGLESSDRSERRDTLAAMWEEFQETMIDSQKREELQNEIVEVANKLQRAIPGLNANDAEIARTDLLIDLPDDRVTSGSRTLPMRTEGGRIVAANLFFNPEKWSEAYKSQKQCGFVYARKDLKTVVWLASQIVFFNRFGAVMSEDAHHYCKFDGLLGGPSLKWIEDAKIAGICSPECAAAISTEKPRLLRLRCTDIEIPEKWIQEDPNLKARLEQEFFNVLPGGLVASVHESVIRALASLCNVAAALYAGGRFKKDEKPKETQDLQASMLEYLRASGIEAREGQEVGGGESDIILPGDIVVENKVVGETSDPRTEKVEAGWQSRRYSIALNQRVGFVVVAYKPRSEAALLTLPESVLITKLDGCPEPRAIFRICIPWGYDSPSHVVQPNSA